MKLPDVLPMRPHFREVVWGGRRLQELYHKDLPEGKPIGESFEVSACAGRESTVATGPLAGWSLGRIASTFGEELVGPRAWEQYRGEFPLLIKLLDARDDLSIQVHPDDAYARQKKLGRWGKAEAWYVLHSEGGRIAHGLKEGVGRKELEEAIATGRVEEVVEFFEVEPGEVVCSPPGTVHALCGGVMVYEVQQPSDLTFRLFDYHRLGLDGKPRELHVEAALEVIDFKARLPGPMLWNQFPEAQDDRAVLVENEHFRLNLYAPQGDRVEHGAGDSFLALTLLQGRAAVQGRQEAQQLEPGGTVLVPVHREFKLIRQGETLLKYLIASVGSPL